MNLIDENVERESEEKQKKITKLIIIAIITLIIVVILILIFSVQKKKSTLKISVDGQEQTFKSEMFMMADKKNLYMSEKGEIYISVRNIANMLNVEYFNDEYKGKGEDVTKCCIKAGNEYTSYISGSANIYKVRDNKAKNEEIVKDKSKENSNNSNGTKDVVLPNDYEYEYFTIEDGVRYVDNELYASKSAIELGFNVSIAYDKNNKSVKIYTLDGLMDVAKKNVGSLVVSEDIEYYNKKLLKYGLALIKNSNGDYGITKYINYQGGNHPISCKYSNIKFIESLGCFIVTTSDTNEQGILKADLKGDGSIKTLIDPRYQEINQLTEDGTLYVIRENERYGIIKIVEENSEVKTSTLLKSEYQTIGLSNYTEFGEMTNKYLINGKYIPVKRDDKWGIVSIDGNVIVIPQYDVVGCSTSKTGNPVICIPNLKDGVDALVFGMIANETDNQQGTYNSNNSQTTKYVYSMINSSTSTKIVYYDSVKILQVYVLNEENQKNYFMEFETPDKAVYRLPILETYGETTKNTNSAQNNTTEKSDSDENSTKSENGQN